MLSLPLSGHVNPIAAVADELRARGHEVAWAGSESFLRPALGPDATIYPIPLRLHRGQGDLGIAAIRSRWAGYVVPHAKYTLDAIDAAVRDFAPDAIGVDQHAVAGALVANRHNLPWASLAPTSMELGRPYRTALPAVEAWIQQHLAGLWRHAGLPGQPPYDLRFSPYLVIAFTTAALARPDLPEHSGRALALVGPAVGARRAGPDFPVERLDPGRRTVLVTVGTLAMDHAAVFYQRMVAALAPLGERLQAIVVTPDGTLPGDVPAHVMPTPRVALPRLLPHVDAVVSHGGLNTVCETLHHGIPLLVAPVKDDQGINAAQVEAAGAGRRVSFFRARPDALRAALLDVLDRPAYRAAAARVGASFEAAGGAVAAAGHLATLAAAGGRG
ncbi:glycosyltransferase [Luedemannella helvata]|uniref:Glycosyltransferase n=2 Tax=Luedemannella helvata TaxID=349315 RepID=A0ABN2JXT3_9ACTN